MQNDSFKMRQHSAPDNRSEETHRRTDGYMYFFTLVVGYFACAQYDDSLLPPSGESATPTIGDKSMRLIRLRFADL